MRHNYVLGMSYRTAAVAQREVLQLAIPNLEQLHLAWGSFGIQEIVLVSTCNRCEIYLASQRSDSAELFAQLRQWWLDRAQIKIELSEGLFYWYAHRDAVEHLFRVACSLDSLLLGEAQILGQLKSAYLQSCAQSCVKLFLHQLFQSAFALGKEVRAKTGIGQGALSISLAAVQMARKVFGDLKKCQVVVLGAGEMAHLAGLHLRQAQVSKLVFCNRSLDKAQLMAERHQASYRPWEERFDAICDADVVISATSSPVPIVNLSELQSKWFKRRGKSSVMVDIAIPRDLDEHLESLDGVFLFAVDDLQNVMDEGRHRRQDAVQKVEELLRVHADHFVDWYRSRESVPGISVLRGAYEYEMQKELLKWQNHPAREFIQSALHALGGQLLHQPSEVLRQLGQEGMGGDVSVLMMRLFGGKEKS